jgi:uncharacterized protein YrrD
MPLNNIPQDNFTGVNRDGVHPNLPLRFLSATSIIREKVENHQGEHLGKIEDIMMDITTGQIEYYVIAFGGFLTINEKYFAIPFKFLKVNTEKKVFIFNESKETLEKAPGIDMSHWPETNFHAEETYWSFLEPTE